MIPRAKDFIVEEDAFLIISKETNLPFVTIRKDHILLDEGTFQG